MKFPLKVKICFASFLDRARQIWSSLFDPVVHKDQKILISEYRHIVVVHFEAPLGAAVIATATLRSLKQACPNLQVTAIASGHSLDLLEACPYISKILSAPNPIKSPLPSFVFALIAIWPQRKMFDAIVLDGGNRRTLITLFALLTGIKIRVGYGVNPWLLHVKASEKEACSNIAINNRAFDSIAPSPLKEMEPYIFFFRHDAIKVGRFFQNSEEERLRIVLVTETSLGHPNAWYGDRFVLLAEQLITQYNALIALVGAASQRSEIEALRDRIGFGSFSLAGHTTPRELAAFMANCDFCISVDTGAMHVARSVSLPTVILANAAQPVTLWLPSADLDYIELIRKDYLPCSICWKHECTTRECMDEIGVQDVVVAFARLKSRVSWGITNRQERVLDHIHPSPTLISNPTFAAQ